MEHWDAQLDVYPSKPQPKDIVRTVRTAGDVLKNDLADFEIEWIIETLLYEPVNLINIITSTLSDAAWTKPASDGLKLMTKIVEQHGRLIEKHYDNLIKLCCLQFDATSYKHALEVLNAIAKTKPMQFDRYLNALKDGTTNKAPLALLVGTICEYHPEIVSENIHTTWRTYLSLLEATKNTDTVTEAYLQGISGLFRHFINELPVIELNGFYKKLSQVYIFKDKCVRVCLKILSDHSDTLGRMIANDKALRMYQWELSAVHTVINVYTALCDHVTNADIQKIITEEIVPQSTVHKNKYFSLRVLTYMQRRGGLSVTLDNQCIMLERHLRCGVVTYDAAEAIAFHIETNQPYSDKLLQTCIMCYHNLPATKRDNIVAGAILNSPEDLRHASLIFLINESCDSNSENGHFIDKYWNIWTKIFAMTNDEKSYENSTLVFQDFLLYFINVFECFLEEKSRDSILPQKLDSLLILTAKLLPLRSGGKTYLCEIALKLVQQLNVITASVVHCLTNFYKILPDMPTVYKYQRIDRCKDEALLCAMCIALIELPLDEDTDFNNQLTALKIMFSRKDVDAVQLTKALEKFELLLKNKESLDETLVLQIITSINKLKGQINLNNKDERILNRNILMFLGKHRFESDFKNNNNLNDVSVVNLKETFHLNIFNNIEGVNIKINLQKILSSAISSGDAKTLEVLLVVLCSMIPSRSDENLRLCLTHVIHALSHSHSHDEDTHTDVIQQAMQFIVPCIQRTINYISSEISPGVRKLLSNAVEDLISRDAYSDQSEAIITNVYEKSAILLKCQDSTSKRAGLDLTETLLVGLKDNSNKTKEVLPELLILIIKTLESGAEETFKMATDIFKEKIELFETGTIDEMIRNVFRFLINETDLDFEIDNNFQVYKNTVSMSLEFVKNIFEVKDKESSSILDYIDISDNRDKIDVSIFVLAKLKVVFNLDNITSSTILSDNDFFVLNSVNRKNFGLSFDTETEIFVLFFEKYSDSLLDLQYNKTLQLLLSLLKNLNPKTVIKLQKNLMSCMNVYQNIWTNNQPKLITDSFESWCHKLPICELTNALERHGFLPDHHDFIHAFDIYIRMFNVKVITDVLSHYKANIERWPYIILNLFSNNDLVDFRKSNMAVLSAILSISLKFLNRDKIKDLLQEGSKLDKAFNDLIGVKFGREFVGVFFEYLLDEPFLMVDFQDGYKLLNDVLKYFVQKKCPEVYLEKIILLVNQIWPIYAMNTDFDQKQKLINDLSMLPNRLPRESNPMRWVLETLSSNTTSLIDKGRLVCILEGSDVDSYPLLCKEMPSLLSELNETTGDRLYYNILLLTTTKNLKVLDFIITLASGDETKGWWDELLTSSMTSLASDGDLALCEHAFSRMWGGVKDACDRIILPLLRYSTSSFCERFYSIHLVELLSKLKKYREPSIQYQYKKCISDKTKACRILQLAFEKIPASSIESPNSVLYAVLKVQNKENKSWYLVRELYKLCFQLRESTKIPDESDDELKYIYRQFHVALYKCMSAAVCCRKPTEQFYEHVMSEAAWERLVDEDESFDVKIKTHRDRSTIRQPVCVDVSSNLSSDLSVLTATSRTAMFLSPLSENGHNYDLMQDNNEEVHVQELQVPRDPLNCHPVTATLTAVICHLSGARHEKWRETVAEFLKTPEGRRNCQWLLARAICNAKDELQQHAKQFAPALLAMVANTPVLHRGSSVLNGLHIEILETITEWEFSAENTDILKQVLCLLIKTCIVYSSTDKPIYKICLDILGKTLDKFGKIDVEWCLFENNLNAKNADQIESCCQILKKVSKKGVYVPNLLEYLLNKMSAREFRVYGGVAKMADLFGMALASCPIDSCQSDRCQSDRCQNVICKSLRRFKSLLENNKGNKSDYVTLLFHAQNGYPLCCSEKDFKYIIDLTPKIPGQEKAKCLKIISTYLQNSTTNAEFTFDIIFDLLATDVNVEAMGVVKSGLKFMSDSLRRRLVLSIADSCQNSPVKVRRAAYEVILEAFEDMYPKTEEYTHNQPKRPRIKVESPVTKAVDSCDVYTNTIFYCLGIGVCDKDEDIQTLVMDGVAKRLSQGNLGVRLYEAFVILVYTPWVFRPPAASGAELCPELCPALCPTLCPALGVALRELRQDQRFRGQLLKEEPLNLRPSTSSKVLTMSRTYQGTFRTLTQPSKKTRPQKRESMAKGIDVQITIDSILSTLLEFSQKSVETSIDMFLEVFTSCVRCQTTSASEFDVRVNFYKLLRRAVKKGIRVTNDLTPLMIRLLREIVKYGPDLDFDGLKEDVQKILDITRRTEGEGLTMVLYEEIKLKTQGHHQFILGKPEFCIQDIFMRDVTAELSIEDLEDSFGSWSNWDNLTMSQKRSIESFLPPTVWVAEEEFKRSLDQYKGGNTVWLNAMTSSYKQIDRYNSVKCFRDIDRWPRRHFNISAISEALEWHGCTIADTNLPIDIQKTDCLVEWATRLMIRRSFLSSLPDQPDVDVHMLSRSHELAWCERASERGILYGATAVQQCARLRSKDLYESETLSWLAQMISSSRTIAIYNDSIYKEDTLKKILEDAETYTPIYIDNSKVEVINGMYRLMLQLHNDLNSLTSEKIQHILEEVSKRSFDGKNKKITNKKNMKAVGDICEMSMNFYADSWDEGSADIKTQDGILSAMLDVLLQAIDSNLPSCQMLTDLTVIKLSEYRGGALGEDTARKIIRILTHKQTDSFVANHIKSHKHLFPNSLVKELSLSQLLDTSDSDVIVKNRLQLVCDPNHTFLQYCQKLLMMVQEDKKDPKEWKTVFDRMEHNIFENSLSGADYKSLNVYKRDLYKLCNYEATAEFSDRCINTLGNIIKQLNKPRQYLRLSELCPSLARYNNECEGDGLHQILGLRGNVRVVKIYEQVEVKVNSIRRPCVIRVLLSSGVRKRYLVKSGEDLRTDEAARRACIALGVRGYMVKPLFMDCGIIEYLEDYQTVRSLIGTPEQLQSILDLAPRTIEDELILSSKSSSMEKYLELCDKLPSTALRSALEMNSVSIQDFITKKQVFLQTLTSMTLSTWLLGLGDRHLENILCSIQDGGVLNVDWSDVFQYGVYQLPPARLTRNFLAVVDTIVLQAKLENELLKLKNSHRMYLASIKMSFNGLGTDFHEKYIKDMLEGKCLSYEVTKLSISNSTRENKEKYIELLNGLFEDFLDKQPYTVEDQVTCLLRQSTDLGILSFTRPKWEPWI